MCIVAFGLNRDSQALQPACQPRLLQCAGTRCMDRRVSGGGSSSPKHLDSCHLVPINFSVRPFWIGSYGQMWNININLSRNSWKGRPMSTCVKKMTIIDWHMNMLICIPTRERERERERERDELHVNVISRIAFRGRAISTACTFEYICLSD
jgi:hypothetical protein